MRELLQKVQNFDEAGMIILLNPNATLLMTL